MSELTEIIDKIDGFMTKKGLDSEEKYKITKLMNETYWEDIKNEDEEEPEEADNYDDFEDPEEELEKLEEDTHELDDEDLEEEIKKTEKEPDHKQGIRNIFKKKVIRTK